MKRAFINLEFLNVKQAGFMLNDISKIMDEKLADYEMSILIEQKLNLEIDKIKASNKVIEQLESLNNMVIKPENEHKREYLETMFEYEYSLAPNENICVALNNLEGISKELEMVELKDKIIKYILNNDQIIPVSIALQVESQIFNSSQTSYFGFETIQCYSEMNPYEEESVLKIKEILDNNELNMPQPYIYERILNPDDYLYSSKRLSTFIFPSM
ncbi:hypothetical protein [Sporosarcina limicola]|uniref:Uncharacterized protein n=1 Tax=Sporosarcina limicola TaxID=34101 RepID=A0A927MMW5_9BACL|nr:hypothetical protein [Sporosarcina limicola]MBE1556888.1 hypothetical protein [Sporosarcina limicola]